MGKAQIIAQPTPETLQAAIDWQRKEERRLSKKNDYRRLKAQALLDSQDFFIWCVFELESTPTEDLACRFMEMYEGGFMQWPSWRKAWAHHQGEPCTE